MFHMLQNNGVRNYVHDFLKRLDGRAMSESVSIHLCAAREGQGNT